MGKNLVIADLHIGPELEPKGYRIPPQTRKMIEKTKFLLKKTKKKSLIILGDLKHKIPNTPYGEMHEIGRYVEHVRKLADITLVKGNHDGGIEPLIPDCEVVPELKIGKYLLIHGHRKPEDTTYESILMAHNHPVLRFVDKLGGVMQEKAWLVSDKITMMPSFNDLIGGTPVEECNLGPIAKKLKPENTSVYLLDGTYIGKISHIQNRDLKKEKH